MEDHSLLCGVVGHLLLLKTWIPGSNHVALVFASSSFSWAQVIPSAICLLALMHTDTRGN